MDMSGYIKEQAIAEVQAAEVWSLQLNESTDITSIAQLMAFVRYPHDNTMKEEFLFCIPLEKHTYVEDIFRKVQEVGDQHNLPWDKLSGITMDGAPPMMGVRSGFQVFLHSIAPNIMGVHCILQ